MSELLNHMDRMPMTSLHRKLAWSAGLGIFLDGYDLTIIGCALILLRPLWHLHPDQYRWLGTSALAGSFIGALVGGRIADRFGRKAIYMIDLVTFFLAAVLSSAAWDIDSLVAFRFILGLGIGADYPLSATYMAEFMPARKRGGVITWTFGLWSAGAIVAGLVGLVMLHTGPSGWRLMLLIGALPALLVIYLRRNLPESPRWYLRHGQTEKAAGVLAQLDKTLTPEQIRQYIQQERTRIATPALPISSLFSPRYRRATLFACLPWFMMDLTGYYLTVYMPVILGHLGFHTASQRIGGSTVLSLTFLLGYIPLALTIDKIGRIWPQIIGFVGGGAGLALVGLVAMNQPVKQVLAGGVLHAVPEFSALALVIIFAGMILAQAFNAFGPGNTTYVLASEVYPTDVRASGHGFATAFSRLGAVCSTFFLPPLGAWMGTPKLLLLLAAGSVLGGVFTWMFRVQTTNRPLIQDGPGEDTAPSRTL